MTRNPQMAHAGFVYTAQHPGDDLATCLYCNVSLSGWDTEDDPMYVTPYFHAIRTPHTLATQGRTSQT